MKNKKIAFVGLGAMGSFMASHVLKAGYQTYGFDVDKDKVEKLKPNGIKTADSLVSVASDIDILIIMVVEAHQTDAILFGNDNVASKMKKGSVIISCSTIAPSYVETLGDKLEAMSIDLLDSPVSGGHVGAQEGTLTLMLSGKSSVIENCKDVLDTFSSKIYNIGERYGMGSKVKVLHQHLASTHIALTIEAMGLCKKAGIDIEYFFDVVKNSAGTSKIFETFAPLLIEKDYTPYSSVNTSEKDLRLVVDLAKKLDYEAPIVDKAYCLFKKAKESGLGSSSSISPIKLYNVDWDN